MIGPASQARVECSKCGDRLNGYVDGRSGRAHAILVCSCSDIHPTAFEHLYDGTGIHERRLRLLRLHAAEQISAGLVHHAREHKMVRDIASDSLIRRIESFILADEEPKRAHVFVPESWWQHLRQRLSKVHRRLRWLLQPAWLLRRRPIRYRKLEVTADVFYPTLDMEWRGGHLSLVHVNHFEPVGAASFAHAMEAGPHVARSCDTCGRQS